MATYMLSVHSGNNGSRERMTDEEMQRGWQQIIQLEADMRAADALRFSGRLEAPDQARVVRPSRGRVRMTDGPFAETKEHLGGFYIVEAPDIGAALNWASKVTAVINTPIEVRAFTPESGS
jgi:hypothetical protein